MIYICTFPSFPIISLGSSEFHHRIRTSPRMMRSSVRCVMPTCRCRRLGLSGNGVFIPKGLFFFGKNMKKLSIGFGGYEANSKLGGKCWWKCQEARLKSYSDRFSLIKFWTACDCLQFPGSRMNESTRHLIHRPSNLIIEWFDHSIKEYNVYIYIYIYII